MSSLAFGAGAVALAVVVRSCVYPVPPDGEPVPQLVVETSSDDASTITFTATPVDFVPDEVQFRVDGYLKPPQIDTTAPYTFTLSTADYAAGPHQVNALGVQANGANDGQATLYVGTVVQVNLRSPNFVFILVDDLDETKSPYWEALPQTKALLADRGLVFDNGFVTDPVCCPAKATFLTGRYSHNTGVWDNTAPDGGYAAFHNSGAENDTIGTRLQASGYSTAFIGKYLNGYDATRVPPGWDEWFGLGPFPWLGYGYSANHNGVLEQYGSNPEDYQTDVLASTAIDYVQSTEAADDQPFFLTVSTVAPHTVIPPAPRDLPNPFDSYEIPITPNYEEADTTDKPTWLRDGYPPPDPTTEADELSDYRRRLGSLLAVDDLVSNLVSTLDADGELSNTVFFFASDNGYNLLSHRLVGKLAPYEESIRVPFVMAGPGVRTGVDHDLVTNLDLAPTMLQLSGLTQPAQRDDLDGRSLVPLLGDDPASWRTDFLIEFNGTRDHTFVLQTYDDVVNAIATDGKLTWVPTYRAVRTTDWLYVRWYIDNVHEYELYDMNADPYELDNLLATPEGATANAAVASSLESRLDDLLVCSGPTCRP